METIKELNEKCQRNNKRIIWVRIREMGGLIVPKGFIKDNYFRAK